MTLSQLAALLLFNLTAFALVEISLIAYLLAPETTHRSLTGLNSWIASRRRLLGGTDDPRKPLEFMVAGVALGA